MTLNGHCSVYCFSMTIFCVSNMTCCIILDDLKNIYLIFLLLVVFFDSHGCILVLKDPNFDLRFKPCYLSRYCSHTEIVLYQSLSGSPGTIYPSSFLVFNQTNSDALINFHSHYSLQHKLSAFHYMNLESFSKKVTIIL